MKKCRACNYLAYEDEIKGVCPACGLPETVFQPYTKKATGLRNLILEIHSHSILLHIPQAIGPIIILLYLSSIFLISLKQDLYFILKILIIAYPFAVAPALLSGIMDGKLRFIRITTPILKKKLLLASSVLIITTGMSIAAATTNDFSANIHLIVLPVFISLALQGTLARMGIRLVACMMSGK